MVTLDINIKSYKLDYNNIVFLLNSHINFLFFKQVLASYITRGTHAGKGMGYKIITLKGQMQSPACLNGGIKGVELHVENVC